MANDPDRATRFVEVILSHSERLSTLINDILTLSTLEAKATMLNIRPLDASGTLGKACMLLEENARKKGISLVCAIPDGLPMVMADQGRLEQVLVNLLDNAVKYTPEGGTITLAARPDSEGDMLKISVTDTGIGIPLKDMPRIFERFYRVDEARSREQGGTGLGLAIVKHIVQLHGGDIAVTSEQGKGSVFTVTLRTAQG
jgi:two-component system phosphate regulon sensor histidine kinase PhoR